MTNADAVRRARAILDELRQLCPEQMDKVEALAMKLQGGNREPLKVGMRISPR
jgi:hypothetical protein